MQLICIALILYSSCDRCKSVRRAVLVANREELVALQAEWADRDSSAEETEVDLSATPVVDPLRSERPDSVQLDWAEEDWAESQQGFVD